MMNNLPSGETLARFICGSLLWLVSATLTVMLFISFSTGDVARAVVLVLLAVGLEGAKILTWRDGGTKRLLAWVLLGLSCLASFGAALQTVRLVDQVYQIHDTSVSHSTDIQSIKSDLVKELDRQILNLTHRLEDLPGNWLSWYQSLSKDLKTLREERLKLLTQDSLPAILSEIPVPAPTVFNDLSQFTGWDRKAMELATLVLLSICLEWGALVLLSRGGSPGAVEAKRKNSYDPRQSERFLAEMIALGNGTYLGGRDRVGKSLGLSQSEAKWHFHRLVESGRIEKSNDRMVLMR